MRMYHLTGCEFSIGDILTPQEDGYVHWPESNAMETVLEQFRPKDKLSRKNSVFLIKDPLTSNNVGATDAVFLVTVEVDESTLEQASDMTWLKPIDQGFEDVSWIEDDFTEDELIDIADNYWSGKASNTPTMEYRTDKAVVVGVQRLLSE